MADLDPQARLLCGEGWADYGLIDSGDGRKLERYGLHRFIRPDAQALWAPRLERWKSDGEFVPGSDEDGGGRWQFANPVPRDGWSLSWPNGDEAVTFNAQCTPFRHLGFFPDMAPVWDWMGEQLGEQRDAATLNLFGYTGVGSLALSKYGPVTHVDASKKSVTQARANAALSGMEQRPIRWIVDDAAKFTAREVRRGKRSGGDIPDPPQVRRGPGGGGRRLEDHLPGLVHDCAKLLDADSKFLFLTVYAVRMSSLAIGGLLAEACADLPGVVEHGELVVREEGEGDLGPGRMLPTAIFARWRNS